MKARELIQQLAEKVDLLEDEAESLRKINDLLGERVVCPFGSGIVPAGAEGIITNYNAARRYYKDEVYEAVGVTFFPVSEHEYLPDTEHWFPVEVLDLDLDGARVPNLMYKAAYERNKAAIAKIAADATKHEVA